MIIRMHTVSAAFWAMASLMVQPAPVAAQLQTATWVLPANTAVQETGPRTYHFTVDYNDANSVGQVIRRQRVTGDYTRGLPDHEVVWNNVAVAEADSAAGPFGTPQKRAFMEGFRYRNDLQGTMAPDFFKSFPGSAILERNLVWDTGMFEWFGQNYLDQLHLNEPFHTGADQDVKMPGVGTFRNHDVVLEWLGRTRRNRQDCALIEYRAFLNPVEIATGGMTMHARSDYWGQIWVSLATRQIEYATLYEEVTGEITLPGQTTPQPVSVFRTGRFEPVAAQ